MKKLLVFWAFAIFALPVFAQSTVTGTVTDNNGAPVPGVSVFVEGTMKVMMPFLVGIYHIFKG